MGKNRRIRSLLALAPVCNLECYYAFEYRVLPKHNAVNIRSTKLWPRAGPVLFGLETADSEATSETMADNYVQAEALLESAEASVIDSAAEEISSGAVADSAEESFAPYFATAVATRKEITKTNYTTTEQKSSGEMTRRQWIRAGAFLVGGSIIGGAALVQQKADVSNPQTAKTTNFQTLSSPPRVTNLAPKLPQVEPGAVPSQPVQKQSITIQQPKANTQTPVPKVAESLGRLEPVNLTQVAAETSVNITLGCPEGCVSVDSQTFTKIKRPKVPSWLPSWLAPKPKVIKEISNTELLIAAIVAGSTIDLMRTSLLYPIQTIKTRIQTDIHNYTDSPPPIGSRLASLGTNVKKHVDEGRLYAGIKPSLLVSVPATGVYYGVRDVTKRMLAMTPMNSVEIALFGALIADVVSLCFRTPADALTLRLQNLDQDVGDWFGDSIKRLPMVILTDIPYLLSKISLNRLLIHGNISIERYTEFAILTATVAAFLTTPFDVARTRILVDSDGNFANGKDGGSGEGVLKTMRSITKEGDGGFANLFAGWFERVLYLGLGRAWLEPIQLIGYIGIRDAVLLEWF